MPRVDRTGLLLHVLMGLSTLAAVVWCVLIVVELAEPPRAVAFGLLVVIMISCWLLLRPGTRGAETSYRRPAAAVFVLLGVGAPFVGDGPFTLPLFIMALLVAASVFGPRVAGALVLVGLVGQVVALIVLGSGLAEGLLQLIATAFVFVFGLGLVWLTAEHERQRREIEDLWRQSQRGARAEAELMLADERTRGARDLHDGLGHRLTVINLAITSVDTRRRETFYWAAILVTFALGTAAGDLATEALSLGFRNGVLVFGGLIAISYLANRFGAKHCVDLLDCLCPHAPAWCVVG